MLIGRVRIVKML